MTLAQGYLLGLGIVVSGMLLVRDWRPTVGLMLLAFAASAGLTAQQPFAQLTGLLGLNVVASLQLLTGSVVFGMLLVTGLTFSRDYNLEELDEFGLMELRRAARRAARLHLPAQWNDYVLPASALVILLGATALLPPLYNTAPSLRLIDYAWTLLLLGGLLQLFVTQNLLKLGCGLLLIMLGLQVLYSSLALSLGLVILALLNLAMIGVALVVAYLSGLLYGRSKTLELHEP